MHCLWSSHPRCAPPAAHIEGTTDNIDTKASGYSHPVVGAATYFANLCKRGEPQGMWGVLAGVCITANTVRRDATCLVASPHINATNSTRTGPALRGPVPSRTSILASRAYYPTLREPPITHSCQLGSLCEESTLIRPPSCVWHCLLTQGRR